MTADADTEPANHVAARLANGWIILPAQPPTPSEPRLRFGADLQEVTFPAAPTPFSNTINSLAFGLTVMGTIPNRPAEDAVDAWRQSGGTIKLDHFDLYWDKVEITGSGTLALDPDLQPTGSVSATIKGYDQLMTALSVAGLLSADDLTPAKIALAMLGPAISTYFTIQTATCILARRTSAKRRGSNGNSKSRCDQNSRKQRIRLSRQGVSKSTPLYTRCRLTGGAGARSRQRGVPGRRARPIP
jgi:hypothetical protein